MGLTLFAYPPSVCCQIVSMALAECGQIAKVVAVDPFENPDNTPHPFGHVPVLDHDQFRLYETVAILRYLNARFAGDSWTPPQPHAQARAAQVQAITDTHAYWPLVRQVYSHRVFRPAQGQAADQTVIDAGLQKSAKVLTELDNIATEGLVLNGEQLTTADLHLAPMIGFFAAAPEGAQMLARFGALSRWWQFASSRDSYLATRPFA